jgi:hypothetical protein
MVDIALGGRGCLNTTALIASDLPERDFGPIQLGSWTTEYKLTRREQMASILHWHHMRRSVFPLSVSQGLH